MKIERKTKPVERETTTIKRRKKIKRGFAHPNFDSLFEPDDENPLNGIDYTGDLEEDAQQEVSAALRHVIDHRKSMREDWRITVDTEFWLAICFQSRDQKEEFLQKAGLSHLGDKYLNGLQVAESLGIVIEEIPLKSRPVDRPPKGLRERSNFLVEPE